MPGRYARPVSPSLLYRSALGYEMLMRTLYGRHYAQRMRAVAEQVPLGSSVLELCCGPGTLYLGHLRTRTSAYVGLDVNAGFVARLSRAGVDARRVDLSSPQAPLPPADVALIQASLYHFLPDAAQLVERMLSAAARRVIISEPIRNLATSDRRWVRALGARAADPGVGGHTSRFTEETLDELMSRWSGRVLHSFQIPGGREKVYVLAGGC